MVLQLMPSSAPLWKASSNRVATVSSEPTEFSALWPTVVLNRVIPGHEQANQALLHFILARERENPEMTTAYREADLLNVDHPAVVWLTKCINVSVIDYLRHLGMDYAINWSLQGWANINRFGDYHDPHNHPRAYLSGTYYVRVPTEMEQRDGRNDVRPGRITLYDPRGSVNMTAIKGDPNIEPEHTITPLPGMILLWPAFVNHYVHPNLSRQPRISVSFNVLLKWSDSYLPQQI